MNKLLFFLDDVQADLNRFRGNNNIIKFCQYLVFNHSFQISFWFRLASAIKPYKLFTLLYYIFFFIHRHNQYKTGIQLPIGTKVGKGIQFSHFSCIVINSEAIIGDFCTIFQGVTIGSVRGKGSPIIGNNVVIAAGAKVIGNVKIGNNVFVGANAVVTKDIDDNCVVAGVPAKVINYDGVKNTLIYLSN